MQGKYTLFGQLLVERGIISQAQLDEAVHKQQTTMAHRKIGEILVRLNHISKSHITEGLADQLGIPIVRISERDIPERIRSLIEGNVATLYRVVPIEERGNVVVIATSDPTNMNNLDNVSRLIGCPVEPVITAQEEIAFALNRYYGLQDQSVESMLSSASSASSMSSLSSMSNMSSLDSSLGSLGSLSSLSASDVSMGSINLDGIDANEGGNFGKRAEGLDEDGDDDTPVVRYVHQMILEAFRLRASDIHVEPGKLDVKVRYRIDGVLHLTPPPPKRAQRAIISRLKLMAGMDISERRVPQDGRIKMPMGGKMVDLRVSALPASYGESMVMRILDKSGLLLGLGQLGFSPEDQRTWETLLNHATGVILVTGPTGSGKTTTLYASLHTLNTIDVKLITVEDPVEYQLAGINQVQINHEIGWNFSRALRAIFRQDPDIVMVGEIRDKETAEIAIKAALTGHLVFSTLHTNDTASSFTRLIDIGIKPFLAASGIRAILAQRLVRTICSSCKQDYTANELERERIAMKIDWDNVELFHGAGCDNCSGTGYQGRLGAYELLVNTDTMRQMVMRQEPASALHRYARSQGMKTMREDAWRKALHGITTVDEVIRRTRADDPLERAVQAAVGE
jgi:type II secretory ATPase GspE/PulE/Tfp pilus assembly ATPase PilB-like protein